MAFQFESTSRVLKEDRVFPPDPDLVEKANLTAYMREKGFDNWQQLWAWSVQNREQFYGEIAGNLHWFRPWDSVLKWDFPEARWFVGGTTNVCYNALDRHMGTPVEHKVAFFWEGENGDTEQYTYGDLYRLVNKFAAALQERGIGRGDRVVIYLPRVIEQIVAMLALIRLGAIHSVVFSGFSAQAIQQRIADAEAKAVITADGYYYRGKIVAIKDTVDEAADKSPSIEQVIVVRRGGNPVAWREGRDIEYADLMNRPDSTVPCTEMDADDTMFILYTSGSTGKPKGVVHTHGSYQVGAYMTSRFVFDLKDDDVFFCTADPGWITGHSYIVYGPLMNGATQVFYEGAPMTPNPGRFWSLVEKYRVTIFYTAPTAIRALMKFGDAWPAKYDLSSLRMLGSVGEPINPEAWAWYRSVAGDRCPVLDTWWQTETGCILIAPTVLTPLKPGSATLPMLGIEADVVDSKGEPVAVKQGGYLIIRHPWPGMMRTLFRDPDRYLTYWNTLPGVYFAGDAAYRDEDGYFWIQGRTDDVIMKSGYRLGSMEIESALVSHPYVAEAAVIGKPDPVTGQAIKAFVIVRAGVDADDHLVGVLRAHVRQEIGPIASPEEIAFVASLPKTRSGKIMRRLLRAQELGQPLGDTSSLED